MRERLFSPEGFSADQFEPIGRGSWGQVYGIEDTQLCEAVARLYPDFKLEGVAIKLGRPDSQFATRGSLARQCLEQEVAWGLRQRERGVPSALGLVAVERDGEELRFRAPTDDQKEELAVAMPWLLPENTLSHLLDVGDLSPRQVEIVMADLMARLRLMFEY